MIRRRFAGIVASTLLGACGGAPFETLSTTAPTTAPNVDAGVDVDVGADANDAGVDAADANDADVKPMSPEASVDAGETDASDGAPTCTPIAPVPYSCGQSEVISPYQVCVSLNGNSFIVGATPTECQCQETWSCACLAAYGGPSGGCPDGYILDANGCSGGTHGAPAPYWATLTCVPAQ